MRRALPLITTIALALGVAALVIWLRPGGTRGRFADVTRGAGIEFRHENGARGERHLPETTVGGAGWLDFDGDGFPDIYFVNGNERSARGGQGDTTNRLYRNFGDGTFVDVTAAAGVGDRGYGSGLAVGDYDNDGRPDLYVANYGPDVLYHNEGDGRFREVTREVGVATEGWSSSAAFLDYDNDGHLDLYVCRYVDYDPRRKCRTGDTPTYCSPNEFPGVPDVLYRNRGDRTFEDRSVAAGVAIAGQHEGKSLGVVVLDFDGDGDPDIYVACDQTPNLMFRNNGDGTFTESGLITNTAYSQEGVSQAGMGVDAGDVDLDGLEDIVVTNFSDERNALYLNLGPGSSGFREASTVFGLGGPTLIPLGFGVLLLDHDLDGDLDLYIANGHVQDTIARLRPGMLFEQRDLLLENDAGRRFTDVSDHAGEWFTRRTVSRAAASADFDRDGDEDIVVLNTGGPAVLLRNDFGEGHWIAFDLVGTRSNRDGYGARVELTGVRDGKRFTRIAVRRSARSYASACDPTVRFGLGARPAGIVRVEITWPSGARQSLESPGIDRVHRVVETADRP